MQWSTSYLIFVMAHDSMPSSFGGGELGFGTERGCARKFCYANILEGPGIELTMTASDQMNFLGRRKNIKHAMLATFPANVLPINSLYDVSFRLNDLEITTSALAKTTTTIAFESPLWVGAPGVAGKKHGGLDLYILNR